MRYHTTAEGNIPFTAAEESARDVEEQEYTDGIDTRAAELERTTRDSLLASTDWAANSDVTMAAEMTTYRQGLRDVPAQAGFPNTIKWPTKPKA